MLLSLALTGCEKREEVNDLLPPEAKGLTTHLSALADAVVAASLVETTMAAQVEALSFRLANHDLGASEEQRSQDLLGRCLLLQRRYQDAARALRAVGGDPEATALAEVAAAMSHGELRHAAEAAAADPGAALFTATMDLELDLELGIDLPASPSAPGLSLAAARLWAAARPTVLEDDPIDYLEDPCLESDGFCYYEPMALAHLSALQLQRRRQNAGPELQSLIDYVSGSAEATWPFYATSDAAELLAEVILRRAAGREFPESVRQRLVELAAGSDYPEDYLFAGYLAWIDGDVDLAYAQLHEYVLAVFDAGHDPEALPIFVMIDYVDVSYRVQSVTFAVEWILEREAIRKRFPFLRVPHFYLSWLVREEVIL